MFRLSASQQEIVRLLRQQSDQTVEDLSRHMGITSVAVRQHLESLEGRGVSREPDAAPPHRSAAPALPPDRCC